MTISGSTSADEDSPIVMRSFRLITNNQNKEIDAMHICVLAFSEICPSARMRVAQWLLDGARDDFEERLQKGGERWKI